MQYHYVIAFDDQTKKWSLEDETQYLDGNVWDTEDQEWFWPDENNSYPEFVIDERARQMISVLATIWPAVDTEV
jgi:hypothetical protein